MVHGRYGVFTFDSVELTAYLDDVSMDRSAEASETTVFGQESKTFVKGLKDAKLSLQGKWDSTATTGPDENLTAWLTEDGPHAFIWGPEGDTTGDVKFTGNGLVVSYNTSAPVGDIVAFTAEVQVTGDVARGAYS